MKDKTPADGSGTQSAMRILPKAVTLTRRGFIQGSGLAAVGIAVMAPKAMAKPANVALIESFSILGPATAKTLLIMARDIFPHDRLADRYYVDAISPYEQSAAKDKALKALIQDGVRDMDSAAKARFRKPYAEVPLESDRVTLLKAIESTPFFQKIRGDMVTSLYDNKAIWPLLGYEGSSWEKGGYINRGFNDLDWL